MINMTNIISKSLPITNKKVIEILFSYNHWQGKVLDLGAGEGFFSYLLAERLLRNNCNPLVEYISACDLFPEDYKFEKIKCDYCDFNTSLPYNSNTFNAVCSVEVIEHIENIFHFCREIYRILKPDGIAIITTPNILNVNSRLRTFTTGFPLLYNPLPILSKDPKDLGGHINPISPYYLAYSFKKAGFKMIKFHTDRLKNSAKLLLPLFYLPIKISEKISFKKFEKKNKYIHKENDDIISNINSMKLLLGRTLIIEAVK